MFVHVLYCFNRTQDTCQLKFGEGSFNFSKKIPRRVKGFVRDSHGLARYLIDGNFIDRLSAHLIRNPRRIDSIADLKLLDFDSPQLLWKRNNQK